MFSETITGYDHPPEDIDKVGEWYVLTDRLGKTGQDRQRELHPAEDGEHRSHHLNDHARLFDLHGKCREGEEKPEEKRHYAQNREQDHRQVARHM